MTSQKTRREYIALAVLAASLFFVSTAAKCGGDKRVNRTQDQIEIDNMMSAKVRENLTTAPDVRAADIQISTLLLVVKLNGKVSSENERNKAIQITRDTEITKDGTTHKVKQVEAKDLTVQP